MEQELEENPDAIKKLSLAELNKLIEEDSTNEVAIEHRRELLAQYKKERVTQIKEPKKTVVSKLKEKIKGENQA
jgi:DNA-binding transcriptional MerR regulator